MGSSQSRMALTFSGSINTPWVETTCPKKVTVLVMNWHFPRLANKFFVLRWYKLALSGLDGLLENDYR